jgi:hypothetical protein
MTLVPALSSFRAAGGCRAWARGEGRRGRLRMGAGARVWASGRGGGVHATEQRLAVILCRFTPAARGG